MNILGLTSGHDLSYCLLESGVPVLHVEKERHARIKAVGGDPWEFIFENLPVSAKYDFVARPRGEGLIYLDSKYRDKIVGPRPEEQVWHHACHAANAFFSSNFDEALIIAIDGGGKGPDNSTLSTVYYRGVGTKLSDSVVIRRRNIGRIWSAFTRDVFGLSIHRPKGHQAGTLMAMGAYGQVRDDYTKMIREDWDSAKSRDWRRDRKKKYLEIAKKDDQALFDFAASLQAVTEEVIYEILEIALKDFPSKNVIFTGGCALNAVTMGKLVKKYSHTFYVPPVPYDAGLAIGAAQYIWHHKLGNPRIKWVNNATPYLGYSYGLDEVEKAIKNAYGC